MADNKNWIQGAVKKPGSFTKQAKAYDKKTGKKLSVQGFAKKVEAHPEKFSKKTKQRANFAAIMGRIAKHNK